MGLASCGAGAKTDTSASVGAQADAATTRAPATDADKDAGGRYRKDDGDKDYDDPGSTKPGVENDGQRMLKAYGRPASAAQLQVIAAAVKSYFTAATQENGAKACTLLSAGLAAGLGSGSSGGCAGALSNTFAQQHAQFAVDEVNTMSVSSARVKGELALAVLGFSPRPKARSCCSTKATHGARRTHTKSPAIRPIDQTPMHGYRHS